MDQRLLEILKKAKAVDQRAKVYDTVDKTKPNSGLSESVGSDNLLTQEQMMQQQMTITQPTQVSRPTPNIDVNSDGYRQKVKESKLPPEIMQAMLDNPIQKPDSPGTFSMDEEMIKQINPNYGKQQIVNEVSQSVEMVKGPSQQGFDKHMIRKMIAEEISKALPSIVNDYFDNKIIKENTRLMKVLLKETRSRQ
jgi:hypothetical protein